MESVVFFVMDGRYRISPEDSLGTLSPLFLVSLQEITGKTICAMTKIINLNIKNLLFEAVHC